jgi:hypothetical protein
LLLQIWENTAIGLWDALTGLWDAITGVFGRCVF